MTANNFNYTKQNGVLMKASRRFTKQNGVVKRILSGWTKQNGVVEKVFETPTVNGIKFLNVPSAIGDARPIYATSDYFYCDGSNYEYKVNVTTGATEQPGLGLPAISATDTVVFFWANNVAANQSVLMPLGNWDTGYIEYSITSDTCLSTSQQGAQYGVLPLTRNSSSSYCYYTRKDSSTTTELWTGSSLLALTPQPFDDEKCSPIGLDNSLGYAFILYDGKVYITSYETNQAWRYESKTLNVGAGFVDISGTYTTNGQDLFCSVYDPTNQLNKLIKFNTVSYASSQFQLDAMLPQKKTFIGAYNNYLFFITPVINGTSDIANCSLEKYDSSGQRVSQILVDIPAGITYDKRFTKPTVTSTRYAAVRLDSILIWFDLAQF